MTDWEKREAGEAMRLHMERLVSYFKDLDSRVQAHLAGLEQRLDSVEKKLEQLDGGLDRAARKTESDKAQKQ